MIPTRRLLLVACLFALSLPARAAGDDKDAAKKPAQKKVLRLEEFTVEGRIQKPQAFFILQRSNLNFDGADRNESFLPKIKKSCEKDPF